MRSLMHFFSGPQDRDGLLWAGLKEMLISGITSFGSWTPDAVGIRIYSALDYK